MGRVLDTGLKCNMDYCHEKFVFVTFHLWSYLPTSHQSSLFTAITGITKLDPELAENLWALLLAILFNILSIIIGRKADIYALRSHVGVGGVLLKPSAMKRARSR